MDGTTQTETLSYLLQYVIGHFSRSQLKSGRYSINTTDTTHTMHGLLFSQKWERASQEEQNDANFSFIAPSTVE